MSESVRRFDLALQRSHLYVYTAATVTGLIAARLHVFELRFSIAATGWVIACTSALIFHELYRRGVSRQILNPLWLVVDIALVDAGIYATGGIHSPWFIWFLPIAAAAAFAAGKRAAHIVSFASAVSYIGVLMPMGQATLFNDVFLLAVTRMLFLFGASYFFLAGIGNLQEKRLLIRKLEANEARKVDELTRLTQELRRRSQEIADANRRIQEADRLKSQ